MHEYTGSPSVDKYRSLRPSNELRLLILFWQPHERQLGRGDGGSGGGEADGGGITCSSLREGKGGGAERETGAYGMISAIRMWRLWPGNTTVT